MHELTDPEITKAVQKVFKRCQTDMEFRRLCLTDPAAAIEEVSGKRLPPNVTLRFTEDETLPDPAARK
ncbi:MAG: hypothetical protein ACLPID_05160 [Beijerinckiaceae bacterium]